LTEAGNEGSVRSLEPAERLEHVLDLLLGAGRILTRSENLSEALSQIAGSIASRFAAYCQIECTPNTGDEVRVSAGTMPAPRPVRLAALATARERPLRSWRRSSASCLPAAR